MEKPKDGKGKEPLPSDFGDIVLSNMINNEEFCRRAVPVYSEDIFETPYQRLLFSILSEYVNTYHSPPSRQAISVELASSRGGDDEYVNKAKEHLEELNYSAKESEMEWLYKNADEFVRHRSVINTIFSSVGKLQQQGDYEMGSILDELKQSLQRGFETDLGMFYFDDAEERFDKYMEKEDQIPFDISILNKATNGGIGTKSLNVILAGTHVGKTMTMCHLASSYLSQGLNVLYISMEMSREEIAKRIDANMLDIPMENIPLVEKEVFCKQITEMKQKVSGELVIEQYATSTAGAMKFRRLIDDLKTKKNFKPDVVVIDYINICKSDRVKLTGSNSYNYVKAISEEIRALGVDYEVPIWTATQTNREGFNHSDVGLENTSESFGLPATADFMMALINNDDLAKQGMLLVKILKNRFGDSNKYNRFLIGVQRNKAKIFDVGADQQRAFFGAEDQQVTQETSDDAENEDDQIIFG